MVSAGMQEGDSRSTSEVAPPQEDAGNNDLCRLCLQALTIDDQAAGGSAQKIKLNRKTTISLDLAGFTQNYWQRRSCTGPRQFQSDYRNPISPAFCAGDQHERLVTLPRMPEISQSVVGRCRFCLTIRALFVERYAEKSWWNEPGSSLCFTIQYEWCEYRPFFPVEGRSQSAAQDLQGLAVLIRRPGLQSKDRDVYVFDVVAMPGTSSYCFD